MGINLILFLLFVHLRHLLHQNSQLYRVDIGVENLSQQMGLEVEFSLEGLIEIANERGDH